MRADIIPGTRVVVFKIYNGYWFLGRPTLEDRLSGSRRQVWLEVAGVK